MKQHEISVKTLNMDAVHWVEKLRQVLLIQDKGKGTVKNYMAEMMLLFKYYNNKAVADITQTDIEQYIVFIKTVHKVGRTKCRSVASACAFFSYAPSLYAIEFNTLRQVPSRHKSTRKKLY